MSWVDCHELGSVASIAGKDVDKRGSSIQKVMMIMVVMMMMTMMMKMMMVMMMMVMMMNH